MKRTFLGIGAAAIALGVVVLVYRGPGRAFVRGHVGDVAATMLVYAVVSLAMAAAHRRRRPMPAIGLRALVAMVIATSIEVAQVWWHARSTAGHLVFGSTFDPIDLGAYLVGVAIAAGIESAADRPRIAHEGNERRGRS